jgi:endo-1,4-beta-xylanase
MNKLRRFGILMLLALAAILGIAFYGSTQLNTLRALAKQRGISIGTAVQMQVLQNDEGYRDLLVRHFKSVTPEYEMKFGPLQPQREAFNFTLADQLVAFAKEHDLEVRGHTLIWHESLPNWLAEGNWTSDELKAILRQHINTVVGHYRGKLGVWDVVNEAVAEDGNSLRNTVWLQKIGKEYIEMAFHIAHEVDPKARLFYNDYGGEELGKKSDAIYALVKDLRQRKVPIDGVGLQMHVGIKNPPNPEKVAANIKRLNELGLEVQITEMDVKISDGIGTLTQRFAAQAEVYRKMMQVCLSAQNCRGFSFWGVNDRYSWLPRFLKKPDAPLIFDESSRPKPAYEALVEVLKKS